MKLSGINSILAVMYAGYLTFAYGALKDLSRWNPETKVRPSPRETCQKSTQKANYVCLEMGTIARTSM